MQEPTSLRPLSRAVVLVVCVLLAGILAATPANAHVEVEVFFGRLDEGSGRCDRVEPVSRRVRFPTVATAALEELLEGPTAAERAAGYGGWFSAETAGMLNSVHIDEHGVAHADFRDFSRIIPNASTSCGMLMLYAQLDETLLQFPSVEDTYYSFDGDATAFYGWLQGRPPHAPWEHHVLDRGDRGHDVRHWQQLLNLAREADIVVDGIYGPRTAHATREVQRDLGLADNGIVDPQAWSLVSQMALRR